MKQIIISFLIFAGNFCYAQNPVLIGANGNNTGITRLELTDSTTRIKNLLVTDYSTKQRLADSMAFIKQYGNTNYVLIQRFLDSIAAVRSAIGTGGGGSNQVFFWAANTPYLIGQPVQLSIVGQRVLTHSFANRTSGTTLDAAEMSAFVYQSQSRLGTWQSGEVYPAGFQILRTVNGVPTILENQLTHVGETTFDATEAARWATAGNTYALPTQTGQAGRVLGTDGTTQSWVDRGIALTNGGVGAPSYTPGTTTLNLPTTINAQKFALQTTAPTVTNDTASLYFREIAERREMAYVGRFGDISVMQRSFNNRSNSYFFSNMTNGFLATGYGGFTTSGTLATRAFTPGTIKGTEYRTAISTTAVAGNIAFIRSNALEMYGGENIGGVDVGGYYVDFRFGKDVTSATANFFQGIHTSAANPANLDATTNNTLGKIGIAYGVGTGNYKLVHNILGTAPTIIDLPSCPINTTDYYRCTIYNPPNSTTTYVLVTNLQTRVDQKITITTNKPTNLTPLARCAYISNDADLVIVTFVVGMFNLEK